MEATLFGTVSYYNYLINGGQDPFIAEAMTINSIMIADPNAGQKYFDAMESLLHNYSSQNVNIAIGNFIKGASKGHIYKNTPVKKYNLDLIKRLYPLLSK